MRTPCDAEHIQIEITNACNKKCSNCTRFCTQVKKPYFMPLNEVKRAIDSLEGYKQIVGIMGGEPTRHPQFKEICKYAASKFDCRQLGLWTALPKGHEYNREVICDTFFNIFVNDHSRDDIMHWPMLVGIQELVPDKRKMWNFIEHCWCQNSWCASINPRGAWFCECAASMAMLYEEGEGWPVEKDWWYRIQKDYTSQIEQWCPRCGMAAPLNLRSSNDELDDISPLNYAALKDKVRNPQRFVIHNLVPAENADHRGAMAKYKDFGYRNRIAARYGMFLIVNEMGFWTPYLDDKQYYTENSILKDYQERFGA
jgi:organic radical activating enzyme